MGDDELERIKQRKLAELRLRAEQEKTRQKEQAEQEMLRGARRKQVLDALLEPDAARYLGQLRASKPDVAKQIEDALIMLAYQGQLTTTVDELSVKWLERRIERKEPTITIQRRGQGAVTLGDRG